MIDNDAIDSSMTRSKRSSQASMSRFTAQKSGLAAYELSLGSPPKAEGWLALAACRKQGM
jgi:hypothetical protein